MTIPAELDVITLALDITAGETRAATELIAAGERGVDISSAIPALSAAVSDTDERFAKEALWALYIVVWQGRPLGDARTALEEAAKVDRLRSHATLALSLDDLNQGHVDETLARMDEREDAGVQFAVAHALTDYAERTQDRALFERVLAKIPFGIVAPMLSNGVAGSILAQVARGGGSFTGKVLSEVASATTDNVKAAPLFGLLMKIQERLR